MMWISMATCTKILNKVNFYKQFYGPTKHTSREQVLLVFITFIFGLVKILMPPRSSDLTPCHFYLWGYLKDIVGTREELVQRIENASVTV
jgi:hypothetical protein